MHILKLKTGSNHSSDIVTHEPTQLVFRHLLAPDICSQVEHLAPDRVKVIRVGVSEVRMKARVRLVG